MKHQIFASLVVFIISVCSSLSMPALTFSDKEIKFDGITYTLSDNVLLLDAENKYGKSESFCKADEVFSKINDLKGKVTLLVAPSVYWLDDPEDPEVRTAKGGIPFAVRLYCDTLSIIGLSNNPEDIVFAVNRGQTQGAVGNFTMFHFNGASLSTKNITFGNYCNVDLEYPRNPKLNRKKRKDAIVQAQIGICENTDRFFAENCRFISRLNLCPFIGARRSLYDNCYFECTDDALSGSAVYLDCRFKLFSSKPFYSTAETGAVFLNCDITCLGSDVQYFTKVPGQITAIDTRFYCENPIEIQWTRDASDIICRQENISLNGKPYIIDAKRPELGPELTQSKLRDAYVVDYEGKKYYNLPNLLNGDDAWDPKEMNAILASIERKKNSKLLGLPVALRVETEASKPIHDGEKVTIRSTPLLWGSYPTGKSDVFDIMAENSLPEEKEIIIPVSTLNGLSARLSIKVEPKLRQSPKFKKKPFIKFDKASQSFRVDYALTGKGTDKSSITWYRVLREDNRPKVVALNESEVPEAQYYKAKAGDFGYGIVAVVKPTYKDSHSGMPEISQIFEIVDPSQVEALPESYLATDFSNLYIGKSSPGIPGAWSFDVFKPADTSHVDWQPTDGPGWYYGKGFDASTGIGLVQSEKGARLTYIPARDVCKDMTVSLIAEPAKSGGQGFGSATTQYMDICVKFDPINLNGFALRIERTPDHDRAVSFSLVKYEERKTSRISDEVISNCYRNPCHISVGFKDGVLYASANSDAPPQDRKCCGEVVEKVELSAPVEDSTLTGFCIQHTGSTGPSSTLIRDLSIQWN